MGKLSAADSWLHFVPQLIGGALAYNWGLRAIGAPPGTGTVFVRGGKDGMRVQNIFDKDVKYWKEKGYAVDDRGYMYYRKLP